MSPLKYTNTSQGSYKRRFEDGFADVQKSLEGGKTSQKIQSNVDHEKNVDWQLEQEKKATQQIKTRETMLSVTPRLDSEAQISGHLILNLPLG